MQRSAYPFPLAVNSSHHSHYHRFLLGADPSVLEPFPKPYCTGAIATDLGRLTESLNLQRWRKLYHGAFPWVAGFGPSHFDLGNVPSHRPLPPEYGRPPRRFAAFDFVQIADPSVSALALVAGDRRVLDRFVSLGDEFCARLEEGACSRDRGPSGARATGRLVAGQFAEPNDRWLMPLLHVHSRVLNLTSFAGAPCTLSCLDHAALGRAGRRARLGWATRQAEALSDLGYRVRVEGNDLPELRVDGVSRSLIAAIQAPRIAVLRLLERMIVGDHPRCCGQLGTELPAAVIASMAEQVESALALYHARYKPAKVAVPPEGPWRASVREHLCRCCPGSLAALDSAAARARATLYSAALYPSPPLDPAHCHVSAIGSFEAACQMPCDPELGVQALGEAPERVACPWLAREFEAALGEVSEAVARAGPGEALAPTRRLLATIDQLAEGADPEQLRQSRILLDVELERRAMAPADHPTLEAGPRLPARGALVSLDQLFEDAPSLLHLREQEIGGRSL